MIGLLPSVLGTDPSWRLLHTKVSVSQGTIDDNGFVNYEEIPLEVWNNTHFSDSLFETYRFADRVLWFPYSNMSLKGNLLSNDHHTFLITVGYAPNEECGMTFQEYIENLSPIELNLVINNEYIDPKDFENPIKKTLTTDYNYYININFQTISDLFIKK